MYNNSTDGELHKGHRQRVFDKYKEYGLDSFREHEVLEMLLFYSIPRANTNPMAHKLLKEFGSLINVFSASPQELMSVDGVGERTALFLSLFRAVREYENTHIRRMGEFLDTTTKAGRFCTRYFSAHTKENAIMLLLNARQQLLNVTVLSKGTHNETAFYIDEIIKKALNMSAPHIIIAHNHPGGILEPSINDIRLTLELNQALKSVKINLLDHLLCCDSYFCSFRERGLFNQFDEEEE